MLEDLQDKQLAQHSVEPKPRMGAFERLSHRVRV